MTSLPSLDPFAQSVADARGAAWAAPDGSGLRSRFINNGSAAGLGGTMIGVDLHRSDVFQDRTFQANYQREQLFREQAATLARESSDNAARTLLQSFDKPITDDERRFLQTQLWANDASRAMPLRAADDMIDPEADERAIAEARLAALEARQPLYEQQLVDPALAPSRDQTNDDLIRTTALPADLQPEAARTVQRAMRVARRLSDEKVEPVAVDSQPADGAPWWVWLLVALIIIVGVAAISIAATTGARRGQSARSLVIYGGHAASLFTSEASSMYARPH